MDTPIISLVGQNIAGRRAIVVQPHNRYLYRSNDEMTRILTEARIVKKADGRWLYLYWEKSENSSYSGWRLNDDDTHGTMREIPVIEFVDRVAGPGVSRKQGSLF